MAKSSRSNGSGPGWLASLLGAALLVVSGFLLGLVVGVVKEEPVLVMGHLAGRSEEIDITIHEEELLEDYSDLLPESSGAELIEPSGTAVIEETMVTTEAELPAVAAPSVAQVRDPLRRGNDGFKKAVVADSGRSVDELPRYSATAVPRNSGFSVQVGAFAESASAQKVANGLKQKGFPVYVTPAAGSKDGRWRVRVGPIASKQEAQQVAEQLKIEEGLPTWVRSEGGG
jgi:cell division septation protein DedD